MQTPNIDTFTKVTGPPTGEYDIYSNAFRKELLTPEVITEKLHSPHYLTRRVT